MMQRRFGDRALLGALLLSLGAPMATAGPQEDAESAEKAYKRGDVVSAMTLWRKAGEQGYAPAQARMGDVLDPAGEDEEAVSWYRKAADQGNSAGEYGLGIMYYKGEGIKKNDEKARTLILQAANKNYVPAMRTVMEFYKAGAAGLPLDLEQAGIWEDRMYAAMGVSKPAPKTAPAEKKK